MIYRLTFDNGRVDYCTAKDLDHLLNNFNEEVGFPSDSTSFQHEEVTNEEAESILVHNTEYDENDPNDREFIPLSELAVGGEFCIIASSED